MTEKAQKDEDITLNVKSQDGSMICFKLKKSTLFKKMMGAYCERNGVRVELP